MSENYQKTIFNVNDDDFKEYLKQKNITENSFEEMMCQSINWFNAQPHYPNFSKDDPRLRKLMAMNGFNTEKFKKKCECYLTYKTIAPDLIGNYELNWKAIKKMIPIIEYSVMPNITAERRRIIIFRLKSNDADLFDFVATYKLLMMCSEFRLFYESIYDDIFIWDLSNLTIKHAAKINPLTLKKISAIHSKCFTAIFKEHHLLNLPSFATALINIVKLTMKKKLVDRMFFHSNYESLQKHIDKKYLPKDFGGECGSIQEFSDRYYKAMFSPTSLERFEELASEKSDESKRPPDSANVVNEYTTSIEGSFRFLELD